MHCPRPQIRVRQSTATAAALLAASTLAGPLASAAHATQALATVRAATPQPVVPDAPAGLIAYWHQSSVLLQWSGPPSAGGSPVTGYQVYRSGTAAGIGFGAKPIATLPASATTYADTAVASGKNYYYDITATNSDGESAPGPVVKAVAPTVSGPLTTLTQCTASELTAAVAKGGTIDFGCDTPITLTAPLTVAAGQAIMIDANGHAAVLDGNYATQLFRVAGGSLTLVGITLQNGAAKGADGTDGADGKDGGNGTDGQLGAQGANATGDSPAGSGTSGGNATPGKAGAKGIAGGNGGSVEGGAMVIAKGAAVTILGGAFSGDSAVGGKGAKGGDGGNGGNGGQGGSGGSGGTSVSGPSGSGGSGGSAGTGGNGGDGGNGGNGGTARGGAIANAGTLTITGTVFSGDSATGGDGGNGGISGDGGNGGTGGAAGSGAGCVCTSWGTFGTPAPGGNGGNGGISGNGGTAGLTSGGAIYSTGSLHITRATFTGDSASAGSGGDGATSTQGAVFPGAGAGYAGIGGGGGGSVPAGGNAGLNGIPGKAAAGGNGGSGGDAEGGAIAATTLFTVTGSSFTGDTATAANGGDGGDGGSGPYGNGSPQGNTGGSAVLSDGHGGNGGQGATGVSGASGGGGGRGGSALGGTIFAAKGVSVSALTLTGGQTTGAIGGQGGNGGPGKAGGAGGKGGYPDGKTGATGTDGTAGTDGDDGTGGTGNSPGIYGTQQSVLQVSAVPAVHAVAGSPVSVTLSAQGGTGPYTWALATGATLPSWLTLSSGGALSGTPPKAGPGIVTVQVTDSTGAKATGAVDFSVVQASSPPTISGAPPAAIFNQPYTFTFKLAGYPVPTITAATGSLPPGLRLDPATSTISGTPTQVGTFGPVTLTASSSAGSTTATFSLDVDQSPALSGTPQLATVGQPYSYTFNLGGYPAPTVTATSGTLPPGLSLDPATATVSGTPTTSGAYPVTLTASNGVSPAATVKATLLVANSLAMSTSSAQVGNTVEAQGSGFAPGDTVTVYLDDLLSAALASATADASGNVTVDFTVPAAPNGDHEVLVQGSQGALAAGLLTVNNTTVSLTPATAAPGDSVTAAGSGFQPGELVVADIDNGATQAGSATADSSGSVTITFTVPAGLASGSHAVYLTGWNSENTAQATLTVP